PYWVRTPAGKWAIEQPRVHSSSAQFMSRYSIGLRAFGPNRETSMSVLTSRRWLSGMSARRRALGPEQYPASTPTSPDGGDVSRVTSIGDSMAAEAPDTPSARQIVSSKLATVLISVP